MLGILKRFIAQLFVFAFIVFGVIEVFASECCPGSKCEREYFTVKDHLIPTEKNLDPAWVKSLFDRGEKETFVTPEQIASIGMPCGGIGTGQMYVCGDGTLGDWQIFNNALSNWVEGTYSTFMYDGGIKRPFVQGFAVAIKDSKGKTVVRELSSKGFKDIEFNGQYPIALIDYNEAALPVDIGMEVFSPFIPLNAQESGFPATIFNVTIENTSSNKIEVSTIGFLENPVSFMNEKYFTGSRKTDFFKNSSLTMLTHSAKQNASTKDAEKNVPPYIFELFQGENWGSWKVTGTAFGNGPVAGTLPKQAPVCGFVGKTLANSFVGFDGPVGTLTSPSFEINRSFVNFLVGGGKKKDTLQVNLVIDGKTLKTATGNESEILSWRSWDVNEFLGKKAYIEIVDKASDGWGHITVSQIEFADFAHSYIPESLEVAQDFGTMTLACINNGKNKVRKDAFNSLSLDLDKSEWLFSGKNSYNLSSRKNGIILPKSVTLKAGEKHTYTFVVSWHFPNEKNGLHYATRFKDSTAVAQYVLDNYKTLASDTRLWRDIYYDSTLPYWLLDRLHSTVSYLATGTCEWWANGRFWAWEGVDCCDGTCTHVWNYAHSHAMLFPHIARTIREMQDLELRENDGGFHPDTGLVGFRSNDADAADGQLGTILKCYREHRMTTDKSFLNRNWSRIKKVMQYSIDQDGNSDGLIENRQHNTYDVDYYGANTFVGSLYLAALRASQEMAKEVGDYTFVSKVSDIYNRGRKNTMKRLWNGEYFIQDVDLEKYPTHQYATGCLSDQLFGQNWAHQLGLGYIYPEDAVKTTMDSVWRYNWAPDITPYNDAFKPFRSYVSPHQAGLLTCTWPKGGYLPNGTAYKNELWTGIEYQVASGLVWEGYLEQGLAICKAIHERYYPGLKNPYNEVECGDHYARAMASWGVYLALAGFEYHGPKAEITFAPKITPDDFKAAFTFSKAWVVFAQKRKDSAQFNSLKIRKGELELRNVSLEYPAEIKRPQAFVSIDGKKVKVTSFVEENKLVCDFGKPQKLRAGQSMEVVIK